MFSRLFKKNAVPLAHTPPACVIWAIGDIHGRSDLSGPLIDSIRNDLAVSDASRKVMVFLGDHVDRGPDSRGVIDQIVEVTTDASLEVVCLLGNHEDRMLAFLDNPQLGPGWCDYGGREALASYGVIAPAERQDHAGWTAASLALKAAIPPSHMTLLQNHCHSAVLGDYFFSHAGARPGVALAEQTPDDLMWIRHEFIDHPAAFEKTIVHGHTPSEEIVSDSRRIGVDTGAYATNILSAVRLSGQTRQAMQVRGRGSRVSVSRSPLGVA